MAAKVEKGQAASMTREAIVLKAMNVIIETLQPLDKGERERVLKASGLFFGKSVTVYDAR
jgi:hypothetical protein